MSICNYCQKKLCNHKHIGSVYCSKDCRNSHSKFKNTKIKVLKTFAKGGMIMFTGLSLAYLVGIIK